MLAKLCYWKDKYKETSVLAADSQKRIELGSILTNSFFFKCILKEKKEFSLATEVIVIASERL